MKKKKFKNGGLSLLVGIVILFFYVVGTFEPSPTQDSLSSLLPLFGITLIVLGLRNLNKKTEKTRTRGGRKK